MRYRIVEKKNCYNESIFYVQEKGLLWGWNYVRDLHDMIIRWSSEESALNTIRSWYGYKYNKIVNITEVSNERPD